MTMVNNFKFLKIDRSKWNVDEVYKSFFLGGGEGGLSESRGDYLFVIWYGELM